MGVDTDKISVIVPAYNAENYLEDCIDSIFHQNLIHLEIIIIEDGSTDGTPEVCGRLAEKYKNIRLVHQKNAGPAAARNLGLAMAEGQWVMFVDADDRLMEGALRRSLAVAQKQEADLVLFNMQYEYGDGRIQKVVPLHGNERVFSRAAGQIASLEDMMLTEQTERRESFVNMTGPYCKLIRKECTKNCCFPETLDSGEDACFVFQVLKNCEKIVYLSDVFYRRMVQEQSLSMKQDDDFWKRRSAYVNWVLDFFAGEQKEEALNWFCYQNEELVIRHYFLRDSRCSWQEKKKAAADYRQSVKRQVQYKKTDSCNRFYLFFIKNDMFWVFALLNPAKNVVKWLKCLSHNIVTERK